MHASADRRKLRLLRGISHLAAVLAVLACSVVATGCAVLAGGAAGAVTGYVAGKEGSK